MVIDTLALFDAIEFQHGRRTVRRRNQRAKWLADDLFGAVSIKAFRRFIPRGDGAIDLPTDDCIAGVLDDEPAPLFIPAARVHVSPRWDAAHSCPSYFQAGVHSR
jgi:hypothetical protein